MGSRLETGIEVLDRKLDGGVPPGYVVAYTAPPASQSELLLYELTSARGTLYLSTERSVDSIGAAIDETMAQVGSPTVRDVDTDDPLSGATEFIDALPDGANLIIDPMDPLEREDAKSYVEFCNHLKDRMLETGSIAVLHCLKSPHSAANRTITEYVSDAVFDLRTDTDGSEIENTLSIPKFRSGGAPTETIKLELSEHVAIDTSRDIA